MPFQCEGWRRTVEIMPAQQQQLPAARRRINHHDFIKIYHYAMQQQQHRTSINMGGWYPQATIYYFDTKKKRNAYSIDVGSEKNRSIIKNIERFLFYFMNVSIYQIQATIQKLFFFVCVSSFITSDSIFFFVFKMIPRIWHSATTRSVFLWIGAKIQYQIQLHSQVSQVIEINYLQSKSVTQ